MGNACTADGQHPEGRDRPAAPPATPRQSCDGFPPTRSASVDDDPQTAVVEAGAGGSRKSSRRSSVASTDTAKPAPGGRPPLSGRSSPIGAAARTAVIQSRIVAAGSARRADNLCLGAPSSDDDGAAPAAAGAATAHPSEAGDASRSTDRPPPAAVVAAKATGTARAQDQQRKNKHHRHRDPAPTTTEGEDDDDDDGDQSDAIDRVMAVEAELSSFRCEVASAVVETATLLSELRNELRSLRSENKELLAWKAQQQDAAAQHEQQSGRLHRAVTELVQSQMQTQTELKAITQSLSDHKADSRSQAELVHTIAANSDAALRDVQDTRIQLATTEQAIARQATNVAQLEAAVRGCTREQSAINSELRAVRADTTVMQRRFERHRDELLFGGH